MVTTIQISSNLQKTLNKKKLFSRETYEEVILNLIEDSLELSEETKRNITESEKDIRAGRVHNCENVKKELRIEV